MQANKEVSIAQAAELAKIQLDAGDPVMLWGAPGVGKTDTAHQIGAETKRNVVVMHLNLREPVDMRGIPVPDPVTGTTRWYKPDELPQVARDGERGILFLDEINTCSQQMMAVAYSLVLERKVGEYTLPPGWVVMAAGNRMSDRAAVVRMSTALSNRFAHHDVRPDVEAWADWANKNDIAPELVAFIRLRRELLHVMPTNGQNTFPTPRSWARCSKYVHAPAEHRLRLFASLVGDAYAAELDGFIDLYRSMGSLADIIKAPTTAKLPTEPSARYAVCTGLARMATRENFAAIVTYAERLPRELQILIVHDITTRTPTLKNTPTYGKWAVKNQDITVQ